MEIDIGTKFGDFTVISCDLRSSDRVSRSGLNYVRQLVKVVCICGMEKELALNNLKTGNTTNCGCARRRKALSLVGSKVGFLTILEYVGYGFNQSLFKCRCDCGVEKVIKYSRFCIENPSCGCKENNWGHGLSKLKIYGVWKAMVNRCHNKADKAYKDYGGRGILVCEEWHNHKNFISDMQDGYKKGLTIERINVNAGYNKSNCKWATMLEQAHNRRNNKYISHNGELKLIKEWAEVYKISPEFLKYHL